MQPQYQEHVLSNHAGMVASPAVYDTLLNVSQGGAGYNTQLAVAMSLSEVFVEINVREQQPIVNCFLISLANSRGRLLVDWLHALT